jgi:AraC family transcriptional regulator
MEQTSPVNQHEMENTMTQSGTGKSPTVQLDPPHFVSAKALLIAGLKERFTSETRQDIPQLWQRFMPHFGNIHGQVGRVAYGLSSNMTSSPFGFEYMAGVEASSTAGLPAGFSHVNIPVQRNVVFSHHDHVSNIPFTLDAIHKWHQTSGLTPAPSVPDLPFVLERYGEGFDPRTGTGDIEIWTPLKE